MSIDRRRSGVAREALESRTVIAVDTNILARFYCGDPEDVEAARQRPIARKVWVEVPSIFVAATVVLELEWVMRGFHGLAPTDFCRVVDHLLGLPHVTVERWQQVKRAIDLHARGFDFADALHWAAGGGCERFLTFDDRGFARRARRLALVPAVVVATRATA